MGYRELVRTMRQKSGLSDAEAEDALDLMVESIAERLDDLEREEFAGQLPPELQDIALGAHVADREERSQDLVHEFMNKEKIDETKAKKHVRAAWETLKSFITEVEINQIRSRLPDRVATVLY